MTFSIGLVVELLVCALLGVTIWYCVALNKRIERLRSDEESLRATISELITATEIAERAIMGLRATATEADQTLGIRLSEAERLSSEILRGIEDGEHVLKRIEQITLAAARPAAAKEAGTEVASTRSAAAELKARAAAAAERLAEYRRTVSGRAA